MISEIMYQQEHERELRNKWYKRWGLALGDENSERYYRIMSTHDYAYRVLCELSGEKYISPTDDFENIINA